MATYSNVLAWRIPGMGEPGRLPSMGSHRVGHEWSNLAVAGTEWLLPFHLMTDGCHYYPWGLYAVLSRFSCVRLLVSQWTTACQAPLSMGFSRQEYWSVLLCPLPGDLPDARIKLSSTQVDYLLEGFQQIDLNKWLNHSHFTGLLVQPL